MNRRQTAAVAGLFVLLAGLSAWLQFGVLARPAVVAGAGAAGVAAAAADEADYYIERFVSTGVDAFGEKYQLSAARLTHYPRAGRAHLEQPRIVQFGAGDRAARRIQADTGWLDDGGAEVQLAGRVRVTEGEGGGESVATANTMTVRLGRAEE